MTLGNGSTAGRWELAGKKVAMERTLLNTAASTATDDLQTHAAAIVSNRHEFKRQETQNIAGKKSRQGKKSIAV